MIEVVIACLIVVGWAWFSRQVLRSPWVKAPRVSVLPDPHFPDGTVMAVEILRRDGKVTFRGPVMIKHVS